MATTLYDLESLRNLVDGNEEFKKYLIELFIETTPPILQDIRQSFAAKDWTSLYAHSHKIKPTIESMGIFGMKPFINEIMIISKQKKELAKLDTMVPEFCNTIDEVIIQLKENEI